MKNEKEAELKAGCIVIAILIFCILAVLFMAKKEYDRVYGKPQIETEK